MLLESKLFFIIKGKIRLVIQKLGKNGIITENEFVFGEYDMFEVEPYENHTIYVIEESEWISFLTTKFDKHNPDFYKL